MKNKIIYLYALTLIITIFYGKVNAKSSNDNFLKNGSFSEKTRGWYVHIDNKKETNINANNGFLNIYRGKTLKSDRSYVSQGLKVIPDATYSLSCKSQVKGKGKLLIRIWKIDENNKYYKSYDKYVYEKDGNNINIRIDAKTDSRTKKISVMFVLYGNDINATISNVTLKLKNVVAKNNIPSSTAEAPVVDGILDDAIWKDALCLSNYKLLGSDKGAPVSNKTYLVSKKNKLYVAYRFEEPNIKNIINNFPSKVHLNDCAETFISPDGISYYHFIVNSAGEKVANSVLPSNILPSWYSSKSKKFTGKWTTASKVTQKGWTAEICISLDDLNLKDKHRNIFVNFCRHRPSANPEYYSWARLQGKSFHVPGQFNALGINYNHQKAGRKKQLDSTFVSLNRPDYIFVGKPVEMILDKGTFLLPGKLKFIEKDNLNLSPGLKSLIKKSVCTNGTKKLATIECSLWKQSEKNTLLNNEEAYSLEITHNKIYIKGRTNDGVLRGLATLALLAGQKKSEAPVPYLSCMKIKDAPGIKFRGYVLDFCLKVPPKRAIELLKRQVDILYFLKYNAVLFMLKSYSTPSPFPFDSHPEIGKKGATSKKDWLELANYIRRRGMKVIPIVNIWDDAGYILRVKKYQKLAIRPDLEASKLYFKINRGKSSRNMDPFNPMGAKLVFDLLEEVIDTMNLKEIHLGMDELHYDYMVPPANSRKRKPSDFVVESLRLSSKFAKSKGVKLYMWADMLNPDHNGIHLDISGPELLNKLPKDIIMMDWDYRDNVPFPGLKMFKRAGFQTIGTSWYKPGNIAGMIRDVYKYSVEGFCGTSWASTIPQALPTDELKKLKRSPTQIPPKIAQSMSLSAYLAWSPNNTNLSSFPYAPELLYQLAAYRYDIDYCGNKLRYVDLMKNNFLTGNRLLNFMLMPSDLDLNSIFNNSKQSTSSSQANKCSKIGAIVVKTNSQPIIIPLQGKASYISFIHAMNKQHQRSRSSRHSNKFEIIGQYILKYTDGSTVTKNIISGENIVGWNSPCLPLNGGIGILGIYGRRYYINIPVLMWKNPYPEKELQALVIKTGKMKDISWALFSVALRTS
jgi:Glycosyl hydrolase family 20, catalytic domain/Glycosyl hydrolase family 20, domain 2